MLRIRDVYPGSGMFIPDPGCLSRIPDVYPGSRILIFTHPGSRISDPGSKNSNKRERGKKIFVIPFYVATNFTKLSIILVLKCWKQNLGQFSKKYRTFYQKNCQKALKNMVLGSGIRDPGSEIRDPEKTYSGSRTQGSKRHRIPDPDPQHCCQYGIYPVWQA